KDGEIAEKTVYGLDQEQIEKEAMYDGFYAVVTNLEGDVGDIIRINQQRWEIEENFRIMKDELGSRPAFVRREDRIKAHFMTCYISLIIYRLLEKKIGNRFTCDQIIQTLRAMNMTFLSAASSYIPSYTRTELTDALHQSFGFRTDYEIITKASMRTIIKNTKILKRPEI
ncbi:transposase, partial [Faecalicatena acetigenes]